MRHHLHPRLTRGFGSEAVANSTLTLLWCLLPHCANCAGGGGGAGAGGACPSADWEGDGATNVSCAANALTLAGFVSRKRPQPRLDEAEEYYLHALALDPAHCSALAYLTELYVQAGDEPSAHDAARRLSHTCGEDAPVTEAARETFAAAGMSWPRDEPPAAPTPPAPPPPAPSAPLPVAPAETSGCACGAPERRRRLLFGSISLTCPPCRV